MSKQIDEIRKRMANNQETPDLSGLDLDRIKAIDRQAKMYDRTKPVTNKDKGFRDILGENGGVNETWEKSKVPSLEEREQNYQAAYQQQTNEKKHAFKEIYEQKKQNIFQNMDNILNELDAIDKLLKGL